MDLSRKAGVAVVFGIPAIIGSGLTWQLADSWQAVFTYLGILGFIVIALLANPEGVFRKDRHSE